jgi:hypothetical protein
MGIRVLVEVVPGPSESGLRQLKIFYILASYMASGT